ncbi:redoxin domain-containing protein [Exilibacterium tricleocarpae]|uniref:Redoxin domain-containing protein n=1 Tax=Exilibacterium tricleocarpae TaxID=2591008 RepID=A0A545SPC5_9GAMM|nr:redoxin family protein [Exilibacterium tricleocarpae]TQV66716.1 redoxin domain-containing protein [Exilibacterium tricleocarpae]
MGRWLSTLLLLTVTGGFAQAATVDNFSLLDQHGKAHELYYLADKKAIVIMAQGNGCPMVRNALPAFAEIRQQYQSKGVEFLLLNANLQDHRASILKEAKEFSIDLPILVDETQLIGAALELTRTAEVLVIDPRDWTIAYRGPVDDRLHYERRKPQAQQHYLRDALDAVIGGKPVAVSRRHVKGCIINFPERANQNRHQQISYSKTIAPLLMEKCVACHTPGGIGPWAMTDYTMILGFSPMIREVVRTKRMPPWHADPHIQQFREDNSLSVAETRTLIHWIEAGSPRGNGPDPLAALQMQADKWQLGAPDLVLKLPRFDVPATGIVDYQYPSVPNPLDRDVWVKAVAVKPGDRTVLHHLIVGSAREKPKENDLGAAFRNYLVTYAPGMDPYQYPENTGVLVPKGGYFSFQSHYTTSGKATSDETEVGLYFYDKPPENMLRHYSIVNFSLQIPPHAEAHEEAAYFYFENDATIYSLFPHAHYRGKSSLFEVVHPDGTRDPVLSVPSYDFNWQRMYTLAQPLKVAAGTKLLHRTTYDNSAKNPANPDPSLTVGWGEQSFEEMLYGSFMFQWDGETPDNPVHNRRRVRTAMGFGFRDKDMNGRLEPDELVGTDHQHMTENFDKFDSNSDGGLDMDEYLDARRQKVSANIEARSARQNEP